MKRLLFLFVLVGLCAGAASSAPDPGRLRTLLEEQRRALGAQALLFGLWQGDREILTTALGDSMTGVPATTDMHWRIGGITETFQGTLLMMLAEQGRIDLDAPLSRWLPDLLAADRVTVRMLANNTAGYPDYVRDPAFEALVTAEPFRHFTADDLIAVAVKSGRMDFEPGKSQAYSHTDFIILAQVMEKATGQSMKELYDENILRPLDLQDTQFPLTPEIQAPVLHSYLSDRGVYEDATYWNPSWAGATGGLTSDLRDLGRWGRVFGTGALLSPESFRTLTGPGTVGLGRNQPDRYFAYGFVFLNGWYVQNPNMNGYTGGFAYHPPTGTTIIVAATKAPGSKTVSPAFEILETVIGTVTPESPLNF